MAGHSSTNPSSACSLRAEGQGAELLLSQESHSREDSSRDLKPSMDPIKILYILISLSADVVTDWVLLKQLFLE